ncbi:hypothetical protein D1007_30887 [Hordeum vulgare]|nr:hypothetical protein D1007_30887 [Hordeum vulgare]
MAKQQAILDSIRDEAEVEANYRLIRQRQAEADALFDELDAEIEAEKAKVEHQRRRSYGRRSFICWKTQRSSTSSTRSR